MTVGAENPLDEYPDEAVFQASRGLVYSRNSPYSTDGGRYYLRLRGVVLMDEHQPSGGKPLSRRALIGAELAAGVLSGTVAAKLPSAARGRHARRARAR